MVCSTGHTLHRKSIGTRWAHPSNPEILCKSPLLSTGTDISENNHAALPLLPCPALPVYRPCPPRSLVPDMDTMNYEYLVAIVKDAIMSECDGTMLHDRFEDGVILHEMQGKQIEEFAERIATEIHSKL